MRIDFVNSKKDRLLNPAEQAHGIVIQGIQACLPVKKKENNIGLLYGKTALFLNLLSESCLGVRFKAPGVYQEESPPVPLPISVITIPRHPWQVIHNGLSFPGQAVE